MRFKQNKVWLAIDDQGKPIVKDNKFLIKYQLEQDYEYWVNRNGVSPLDNPQTEINDRHKSTPPKKDLLTEALLSDPAEAISPDTVCIFTDGASSGNPGPAGVGVLMRFGKHQKEISRYIGIATNNVAELEAIKIGLLELKKKDVPVRLLTDSNYAYGVLVLGWKAKRNQNLVKSIKELISTFKDLKLVKIRGHHGFEGNERADALATSAIKNR